MIIRPPNILIYQTDDHGQWAAGCYGNTELRTPNMDRLAATGVKMTRAYTPCPVCSPARASFFTGRIPSQHGIHDHLTNKEHPGLQGQTLISELLQAVGYQCALVGKWHQGKPHEKQPGFEYWFCSTGAGRPGSTGGGHHGPQRFWNQGEILEGYGYQAPLLTDHAIDFVRSRDKNRPFFLYVGYTETHSPFTGHPQRLVDHYRGCSFRDIPNEQPAEHHAFVRRGIPQPEKHREDLAQYYAAVTEMDEQIGRMLDELEGAGELENTLIIYTCDHGHMNGHHGLYNKGNSTVPQNFLEESIKVPCLFSWKNGLPAGRVLDAMVDHCDLFNTLLDIAGATPDQQMQRQINSPGRSYLPLLKGEPDAAWRDHLFCEYGNARMIRTPTHKLIRRYPGPNGHFPDEFYDLIVDPRERHNRIDDPIHKPLISDLSSRLERHFDQYEIPDRSGRDIANRIPANTAGCWMITEPDIPPREKAARALKG